METEWACCPTLPPEPFAFLSFAPGRGLLGLLKDFVNEAEARLPGREPLLAAIGTRIIHALLCAAFAVGSPSHFSRVFRTETGMTPLTYLTRVRLERARKRLRAGEGTIATIALASGFATPSHFTTAFRRADGQSPSAFLKALTQDQVA